MAHTVKPFKDAALSLIYGAFHFWRAEAPRIALFIAGKEFEDKRLPRDELRKMMEEATDLPFGQIPVLIVDGKPLAQTSAICSYVGRSTGLYPENDFAAARVDELICFCTDITVLVGPSMRESDADKKAAMRKELAEVKLPKALRQMEKLIERNGDGKYFMGDDLTIGDLCAWRLLGWITSGVLDGIPESIAQNYQRVTRCYESVNNHPKVIEWKKKFPDLYKN